MSKFAIKIPETNFVLKSDSMYQIQPKLDASAPDGFKDNGTSKVITPTIGNTVHAPFDVAMNVWNTGFHKSSKILRGMKEEERDKYLKEVHEHIVKPVEELYGKGALNHQLNEDNDFFDNFGIELKAYRVYNTANVLERLALYLAVLGKELAPKEQSSNPLFKKAQYCVVNQEEAVNIRQEREMETNDAIGIFYMLQSSDKEKLNDILDYLNISSSRTTDKATLNSIFNRWLKDKTSGYQNSKIFIKTYKKFESEEGAEELYVYRTLKELHEKGIIKMNRGDIILDSKPIGAGFKLAASYLMNNSEDMLKFTKLTEQLEEQID